MLCGKTTLAEINRANTNHWQQWRNFFHEGMANSASYETAVEIWQNQQHLPHTCQPSFDFTLVSLFKAVRRSVKQRAVDAGRSIKTDALQVIIRQIVQRRPTISHDQLLDALRTEQGIGSIQDIDEHHIYFHDHNGNTKTARLSGLKDRLTRAKKYHKIAPMGSRESSRHNSSVKTVATRHLTENDDD